MTEPKITTTVAKSEDGTIQITFSIPPEVIEKTKLATAQKLGQDIEVEGFRKGKAPIERVMAKIPAETLVEKTLGQILPEAFAQTVAEEKLNPIIYPKFELVSTKPNESWQIRATTCELPKVELGEYKKAVLAALKSKAGAQLKREQKEEIALDALIHSVKVIIPKVLVDEEVNSRLSNLLARIEKLGLSLDGYLASIGKTAETLRADYETQAKNALLIDIVLGEIARVEKTVVSKKVIDEAVRARAADPKLAESGNTPEQRRLIESVLKKRAVLDALISLI